MSTTFKQGDSRWAYHPYPVAPYTMVRSGCGCTSVADIIVNNPKYANYTPDTIRPWMISQGFATKGHGTLWDGIPKTLQNYGFVPTDHPTMVAFLAEMAKGNRWGVLLFKSGTKGGVTWTTSGHYVAVTDYKEENGQHYLYTRDPSRRNNDGWHSYEGTMKGLIKKCWSCYLPGYKPPETTTAKGYTGVFPTLPARKYFQKGDKGVQVKFLQRFLIWAGFSCGKAGADGILGANTVAAVIAFQKKYGLVADGKFGQKSLAKAKEIKL